MKLHSYYKALIIMAALGLLTLPLLGCGKDVREAAFREALDHPDNAHPAPVKFSSLRIHLPLGQEIGTIHPDCNLFYSKAGRDVLKQALDQQNADDSFAEALDMQGYDVVSALSVDFIEQYEEEILRSEYKVSAKIIDADIYLCYDMPGIALNKFFVGTQGYRGELFLDIEWSVFDNLRHLVAYKTRTQGYTKRTPYNTDGLSMLLNEAFAMAAHNLGADPAFHDLIFYGTKPADDWRRTKGDSEHAQRPRYFDPQEDVSIEQKPFSSRPIDGAIEKIAVTVQAGSGHGSGFFITKAGHILTNAHVVGNAQNVRIVTAQGKKKMTAEVLRRDPVRDVAVLRVIALPEKFDPVLAPVRPEWPKVSEAVYALGAPQTTKLQNTLTQGIVSAHRRYAYDGKTMDFIQSDVSVHGGNSGGPLLDANGNIVGLCVSGLFSDEANRSSGLNLFIPIGEALERLNISTEQSE